VRACGTEFLYELPKKSKKGLSSRLGNATDCYTRAARGDHASWLEPGGQTTRLLDETRHGDRSRPTVKVDEGGGAFWQSSPSDAQAISVEYQPDNHRQYYRLVVRARTSPADARLCPIVERRLRRRAPAHLVSRLGKGRRRWAVTRRERSAASRGHAPPEVHASRWPCP